ncbi:hypothetical protein [Streptomyces sp. NPDC056401]|uniref:hypothetical protein n=1 Tax=Streptomyces sp. NPDC056401 TaxID=3345809 RepID=UPI0035DDC465
MTVMQPCDNEACTEADPLSPCICRCEGWGHAAKIQPGLFRREDIDGDQESAA